MDALLLIDLQRDFLPGGALAVTEGDVVVPLANRLQPAFGLVVATQDWHPAGHLSFAANHDGKTPGEMIELDGLRQVLWPAHCVQGSVGAGFADGLTMDRVEAIFRKGADRRIDSYSGFFDNGHRRPTGLGGYLSERGVSRVAVCGLATDYCVKFTALDARRLGLEVVLIADACRGVNLAAGDAGRAIEKMRAAGVEVSQSDDFARS